MNSQLNARQWSSILIAICLSYFLFEYFYVNYAAFVVDEFAFARQIYQYTFSIPYKDFIPYKGVIGNYLLSPAMFFSHDSYAPLFWMKVEVALLNTAFIACTAFYARRFFSDKAILISLLAVLVNHQMLLLSADLRVDMITSWCCLFAGLTMLSHQWRLSGMIMGLAFLISQKAIWYLVAIDGALLCCWLMIPNTLYNLRAFFQFNFFVSAIVAAYVIFWSIIANPSIVYQSLFYESYLQAGIDWYLHIYLTCWQIALRHGPILFLCWPLTFMPLFYPTSTQQAERHVFIIVLSSLALLQFIFYKQPFPYNFVFVLPAFFLLYANLLSWWFATSRPYKLFLSMMVFAGIAYPLIYSLTVAHHYNNDYQQRILRLTEALTSDGSYYVAGSPIFYQKDQSVTGLKNLIGPQIEYLSSPSEKLGKILLESLYLTKTSAEEVLQQLEYLPVKVFITNQRTKNLPDSILNYVHENFAHFYGSIDIYAPTIKPSQLTFYLKFAGDYRVVFSGNKKVKIDKRIVHNGQLIQLVRGDHFTNANTAYRLIFSPHLEEKLGDDKQGEFIKAVII